VLRRTQRIVLKDEPDTSEAPFVAEPAIATGPVADRRNLEQWLTEVERAADQQKAEKKGLDALRAEVQRTLVTSDGDVISGPGQIWRSLLRPSRLALLVLALVAGGIAAYFATSIDQGETAPPPAAVTVVAEPVAPPPVPTLQILVATRTIALGQRLSAGAVEWKAWPTDAMRDDYITDEAQPQAITEMAGAIARFEFFPGEPIRAQKLVAPGDGYLSAVLGPGERGVSIPVQPDVAAGGFIQPNDHVDVLLTHTVGDKQVAQTVLSNVRILAIAHRLGEIGMPTEDEAQDRPDEQPEDGAATGPQTFDSPVVATLALDSDQAEIITSARNSGALTLVLRSVNDFNVARAADFDRLNANQQIRMTSPFWTK
jgi:pilus assembly protein CpaB